MAKVYVPSQDSYGGIGRKTGQAVRARAPAQLRRSAHIPAARTPAAASPLRFRPPLGRALRLRLA
jgi:hypothetical protein